MKKNILLLIMVSAIVLFSGAKNAFCYTLNATVPTIGDDFKIYGINVTQSSSQITFDIFTDYPGTKTVGTWDTFSGDLAIGVGAPTYTYGVAFTNHDTFAKGDLYNVTAWYLSDHYKPSDGLLYDYYTGKIVTIETGTLNATGNVDRSAKSGSQPYYIYSTTIDANDLAGFNGDIYIYYASADCANDYINGEVLLSKNPPVPEPASLSLLGLGLLGLVRFRKRIKI